MASNSRRKYESSADPKRRKRVEIAAKDTVRVRYGHDASPAKARSVRPELGPRAPRSHQGKRLSNAKRQERERRQQIIKTKSIFVWSASLAVLIVVVWGVFGFLNGPTFSLERIEVSGTRHLAREDVLGLAKVSTGTPLLQVDKRAVRRRVTANPWIESVEVSRKVPDTLVIKVIERTAAAVIDAGGTELWAVSADGYWLGERSAAESATLSIRDLEEVSPSPGKRADSETLLNAVRIAAGLSDGLRARTRIISAPTIERTALILEDDIEVFIGDAEGLEVKDRLTREILEEQKGRLVYINVRVVSSPTWRGLDP
jgi:cell division protein FtsQ